MSDCCDIFRFTDPGDGFSVGEGKVQIDVDSQLSGTSENPVQNKVIYNALQNIHIDVDDELSATSENPVQNKVIAQELADQKSAISKLIYPVSPNLIDIKSIKKDVYINNNNGTEINYASWSATDYIPVDGAGGYEFISTLHGNYAQTDNVYFAYYDGNKSYITGGTGNAINTMTMPTTARFVRLSTTTSVFTGYGAMYGKSADFVTVIGQGLGAFIPFWQYVNGVKSVYVSNNGTDLGDFEKIADAVKAANDGEEWNIFLYSGTHNVLDELGGAAYLATVPSLSGATGGLNLPNSVNLIGLGADRSKVVLSGNCDAYSSLSDSVRDQCVTKTSIINMNQSNKLKNLTVVGQNVRYAIHDESNNSYQNYERIIEDCEVVHNGNAASYSWTSIAALGCGSGSGAKYLYKNSRLKAKTPYSIHDNTGFTLGNSIRFENCEFVADSSDGVACRFATVSGEAETIAHDVVLNNCRLKGTIGQYEEGGKGRKWFIHGGGNTVVPYLYTLTSNSAVSKPIAFDEETIEVTNGSDSTIAKGTPVYMDSLKVKPMGTSDISRFLGVALEDIASGSSGFIKTSGFLYRKDTPLSSWGIGTKLGIVNGAIASVSGDDYVAIGVAWDCARIVSH